MKQTAVEKMIQYFIEQKNNGVSHWCINDLLSQLHQAKAMEKEQIMRSHSSGYNSGLENKIVLSYEYYIKTFKSE